MSLNLHAIVTNAISHVHPHTQAVLFQSTGQENKKGQIIPTYSQGIAIQAQVQSESAATLYHANHVGQKEETRKFYLYSEASMQKRVAGIVRPLSRNGDFLYIPKENNWFGGTWWLVITVVEDFSPSGWASVRATLQVKAPQGISLEQLSTINPESLHE